ncbi:transmembrane protein, putative (macronuclear) [Tetrahymena thermophila SB210]|uniref:Transmembrane protein, putative n=1 Tax=Tetrahymena thermophila (strain SB210) TaxID=312017 RepID=W7XBP8_TETTS|nr:transmembrane protein, putative [Tetrahymena thermophila SB210]EWS71111.1 transmembrane protein, putative [Tetrahymena thermophila SB210]|eukprot:XP_012656354.1 transmembrane protein, putative [Tetrahymena thermophila SB210]
MLLVDILKYAHIKYAQFAIIYLFLTKIIDSPSWPLLLVAFIIDKLFRLAIIYLDCEYAKWRLYYKILFFILQIDELPNITQRDIIIPLIPRYIIMNYLFNLQIAYVFFWCLSQRDENSFYISIPIVLVITYYKNLDYHPYYKDVVFFIKLSAYYGFIYIGIGIKYFFAFFFTQYAIGLIVLSNKIIFVLDAYEDQYIKIFYTIALFIENILLTPMRKGLKKQSVTFFNYALMCKFTLFSTLYLIIVLSITGYIELDKNGISNNLMYFVITVSTLSLIKQIFEVYYYIFQKNALVLEIGGLDGLRKYNFQNRNNYLNLNKFKSIKIIPFYRKLTIQQRQSKEFMYALLFNFAGFNIYIEQIGSRFYNYDGTMYVVFFNGFNVNDLEDYLEDSMILENIIEIRLPQSFLIYQDIFKLFKLTFRPLNPITIEVYENQQNFMPDSLQTFKEKNRLEINFLHIISFQNNIQEFMNNSTSLILYDLYEV